MEKTTGPAFHHLPDPLIAEDREAVIKHFGAQFFELRNLINRYDPLGLLKVNGIREYEPETKTIIIQLKPEMSMEVIHALIYREFFRWIESERLIGPWHKYRSLARAIYYWLHDE